MPILGAQNLTKAYGHRTILGQVSLTIDAGQRFGLVGINGSGKTTLARILAGREEPDSGVVTRARGVSVAYLAQEPVMDMAASALDVALSGLGAWSAAMERHRQASAQLASGTGEMDEVLATQAAAASTIERLGGWDVRYQALATLGHLCIESPDQVVGTMSGGERRRVALARLLIARPDLAILDEPTNHLDIATIEWLEQHLVERFAGSLLLITHDRYLLDRVVTRTLELDGGELHSYEGGWEEYLVARAERAAQGERVEANRQNFLRRELEWLRRQPKARTGKQKARISRANAAIAVEGPAGERAVSIALSGVRSGKTLLVAEGLTVEIAGLRLVNGFDLNMTKGERIGIVGPNGAGKTTLLRALLKEIEPVAGKVTHGQNTRVAYLDQSRAGLLDDETVLANVVGDQSQVTLGDQTMEARAYLQRFLFSAREQQRPVGTLSGGERARVALARVLKEGANLVVLDEPTNDLDVTTLAALEAALLDFGGSTLVVTHDRWFLDRVATSIIAFEGQGRVVRIQGNYASYLRWREQDRSGAPREAASQEPKKTSAGAARSDREPVNHEGPKKLTYAERLELQGLMEKIDEAEARVAAMEAELGTPAFAALDYAEQAASGRRLVRARALAESLVERWSELEARNTE